MPFKKVPAADDRTHSASPHISVHSAQMRRIAQAKMAQTRTGHQQIVQTRIATAQDCVQRHANRRSQLPSSPPNFGARGRQPLPGATQNASIAQPQRAAVPKRTNIVQQHAAGELNPFGAGVAMSPYRPTKLRVARTGQPDAGRKAPAQGQRARLFPGSGARKLSQFPVRQSVLQRMEVKSKFDQEKVVKQEEKLYVVTQVNSKKGGMFGHSELFIEHSWGGRKYTEKIHLQTLGSTRIDILSLNGEPDLKDVGSSKSYVVTGEQFAKIWEAALIIKHKMEQGIIIYAELKPSGYERWREATKEGEIEMSCKSFTDILLIEGGVREGFGGLFFNAPWNL